MYNPHNIKYSESYNKTIILFDWKNSFDKIFLHFHHIYM